MKPGTFQILTEIIFFMINYIAEKSELYHCKIISYNKIQLNTQKL